MTTKTKMKKPVKRATKKRAAAPDLDLSWLDDSIRQAEENLNTMRFNDFIHSLARCSETAKQAAATPENGVNFAGGTRRESRKPMYHLVPIELMQAVAETRQHGDLKYEPANWKKGDKVFFTDCVNHCIEHLWDATGTDSMEDIMVSLGHAATNIGFMLWALRRGIIERKDFERAAVLEMEPVNG
jgi:hypothetical protein